MIGLIIGLAVILCVVFATEYYFWQRVRRKFRIELCPKCGRLIEWDEKTGPEGECERCMEVGKNGN